MKAPAQSKGVAEAERDAHPVRSELLLDPFLTTQGNLLIHMQDVVGDNIEWYNAIMQPGPFVAPRKRQPKQRDRANLEAITSTIQANLAMAIVRGVHPPSVAVSFKTAKRKLTRYDRKGFAAIPRVVKTLEKTGLLTIEKSNRKGIASTITATPALAEVMERQKFKPEHFAFAEGRETIWLSRLVHQDYVTGDHDRELIDYAETAQTRHFRQQVALINRMLAEADLRFEPDGGAPVITSLRQLRRCFSVLPDDPEDTERFDLNGRLFGAWFQTLGKERRRSIRIDGEPVADIDFSSMFLRLAFLAVGEKPPTGDLYAAVRYLGDAQYRQGVKILVLSMLFRTTPLTRVPKDAKGLLPSKLTGGEARTLVLEAFPALVPIFETGAGLALMFRESETLINALLRLVDQKIPALAMHDGLMIARSKADAAARTLQDAADEILGFRLPVTVKAVYS